MTSFEEATLKRIWDKQKAFQKNFFDLEKMTL